MDIVKLKAQLSLEEGVRYKPYLDTAGKITIGIGHNLTDCGISEGVLHFMFSEDVQAATDIVMKLLPERYFALDDVRQRALVDLAFNLGERLATFEKFLAHMNAAEWDEAGTELQNSAWFHQVGQRGPRLVHMITTGTDPAL